MHQDRCVGIRRAYGRPEREVVHVFVLLDEAALIGLGRVGALASKESTADSLQV